MLGLSVAAVFLLPQLQPAVQPILLTRAIPAVSAWEFVPRASGPSIFPSTTNLAFIQPAGLGAPKASKSNPGGAGNAEGNWWTPSDVAPSDVDGKVAEIKRRQAISELNGQYKVEKLQAGERKAADAAAKKAERDAEIKARQARYANRR